MRKLGTLYKTDLFKDELFDCVRTRKQNWTEVKDQQKLMLLKKSHTN